MTKREAAEKLFCEGCNCAQSVACAFAVELALPMDLIAKTVSGFGGGMGRSRETCGAVSGMVYVMSVLQGYGDVTGNENGEKAALYAKVQALLDAFRAENGSVVCRELLDLQTAEEKSANPAARTPQYYQTRPCARLCGVAANLVYEALQLT